MEMQDKKRLTAFEEQAAVLLPQLRARKTEVETKLVKERKAVAEIESCDQAELAAYKEAIAEQRCGRLIILQTIQIDHLCSAQITNFSTEVADLKDELAALTGKLEELNAKKHEYETAIAHAKGQCDQFTRSDAIRLQGEWSHSSWILDCSSSAQRRAFLCNIFTYGAQIRSFLNVWSSAMMRKSFFPSIALTMSLTYLLQVWSTFPNECNRPSESVWALEAVRQLDIYSRFLKVLLGT